MKEVKRHRGKGFYIAAAIALTAAGSIASLTVNDAKKEASVTVSKISQSSRASSTVTSSAKADSVAQSASSAADASKNASVEDDEKETEEAATNKPVTFSMPIKGNIIKQFSTEELVYSATYGDMRVHTGIDIKAETGTLVKASGKGTVKAVTDDKITGKTVVIDHGNNIFGYYCGLNDASVKVNDKVGAGSVIGTVGENPSECLDESHLHFALKNGDTWLSPLQAMGLE